MACREPTLKKPLAFLFLICVLSFLARLIFLPMIQNPGIADPVHYYNLANRLLAGDGFTIDYVWHYSTLWNSIVHPTDHWMPLTAVMVASSMAIFGQGAQGAVILHLLLGGLLLPVLVYVFARQMKLSQTSALIAAAFCIAVPDLVYYSLRPETKTPNMILTCASIVALTAALQKGKWYLYALTGILGGLIYLNRNDGLLFLPMALVTVGVYFIWAKNESDFRKHWYWALLIPLCFGLTVAPWLIRNQEVLGQPGSSDTFRMIFQTDVLDFFGYGYDISPETMLERWTPTEMISKRLFELSAAFYQMVVSLDIFLPVAVVAGGLLLIAQRQRQKLLVMSPVVILIGLILLAYPILMPFYSQSGSFESYYLSVMPLLFPLAAYAFEKVITEPKYRIATAVIAVVMMMGSSYIFLRDNTNFANTYYTQIAALVEEIQQLPDRTGDGELHVITDDPFIMAYYGIPTIMMPFTEDREALMALVKRYEVDYMVFPALRGNYDGIYRGAESDARFELAFETEKPYSVIEIYGLDPDAKNDSE